MSEKSEVGEDETLDLVTTTVAGRRFTPTIDSMASLVIDHPIYEKIGRVAAQWAHIEHDLDLAIWATMGVKPEIGACLTSQIWQTRGRLNALKQLIEKRELRPYVGMAFDEVANSVEILARRRNRIIHDAWYINGESSEADEYRLFPYTPWLEDVSDDYLEETIRRLNKCRHQSQKLAQLIVEELSDMNSPDGL